MDASSVRARTRNIWPQEAGRLVRNAVAGGKAQKNAVLLHEQLQQLTGFSSKVCWSFLERHNVRRPGAGRNKQWEPKMLDYVLDHGYDRAALRFECSKAKLYGFVRRQGRMAGHCGGEFSVDQLRRLMTVRADTVQWWIGNGLLEATPLIYGGRQTWRVSSDQLKTFLRSSGKKIIGLHRIPAKRLSFLEEFLYEGKHMALDLLHTRESKKEGDAFRNGEYTTRKALETDA